MSIISVRNTIMNSMTYILCESCVDYCILVDCGEYETLMPVLERINKKVKAVLLTHCHSDHICGLKRLLDMYPSVVIYTNEYGHAQLGDSRLNFSLYHTEPLELNFYNKINLNDRQILHFEGLADVEALYTPGHDKSCFSFIVGQDIFTGDSYIPGLKTVTNLRGSNKEDAEKSKELLLKIAKNGYNVHCGHHSYNVE